MSRGRIKGDHETKRAEIAEAACQVILRLGLAQASLSEIAREMGYTTGILRHYFVDKEELLLYSKNLLFDRSYECARQAAMGFSGIEKLRAMAVCDVPKDSTAIDRYRLLATFNGHAIGSARLMKLQHRRNERHWKVFEEVINGLQQEGGLPSSLNARVEACGIVSMIDGIAEQIIMEPKAFSPDDLVALMSRYIDGLAEIPSSGAKHNGRLERRNRARG